MILVSNYLIRPASCMCFDSIVLGLWPGLTKNNYGIIFLKSVCVLEHMVVYVCAPMYVISFGAKHSCSGIHKFLNKRIKFCQIVS
jgi:hypothetical protein